MVGLGAVSGEIVQVFMAPGGTRAVPMVGVPTGPWADRRREAFLLQWRGTAGSLPSVVAARRGGTVGRAEPEDAGGIAHGAGGRGVELAEAFGASGEGAGGGGQGGWGLGGGAGGAEPVH